MSRLFVIGDPHLSLGTDKPMDIFGAGWSNSTERFAENWKRTVTDDDTVIINGDISWALKTEEAVPDLKLINELPGKKILMKGNHELWWTSMAKLDALKRLEGLDTLDFLYNDARSFAELGFAAAGTRGWKTPFDDGFDDSDAKVWRREVMRLRESVKKAKVLSENVIVFMHFPPFCLKERGKETEMTELLSENGIRKCFFGHVHGYGHAKYGENGEILPVFKKDGVEYYLVSADYVGFVPAEVYN